MPTEAAARLRAHSAVAGALAQRVADFVRRSRRGVGRVERRRCERRGGGEQGECTVRDDELSRGGEVGGDRHLLDRLPGDEVLPLARVPTHAEGGQVARADAHVQRQRDTRHRRKVVFALEQLQAAQARAQHMRRERLVRRRRLVRAAAATAAAVAAATAAAVAAAAAAAAALPDTPSAGAAAALSPDHLWGKQAVGLAVPAGAGAGRAVVGSRGGARARLQRAARTISHTSRLQAADHGPAARRPQT